MKSTVKPASPPPMFSLTPQLKRSPILFGRRSSKGSIGNHSVGPYALARTEHDKITNTPNQVLSLLNVAHLRNGALSSPPLFLLTNPHTPTHYANRQRGREPAGRDYVTHFMYLGAGATLWQQSPSESAGGFSAYLQRMRNRLMHALNGNIRTKKAAKKTSRKITIAIPPPPKKSKKKSVAAVARLTTTPRLKGRGAYSYENPGPWGKHGRAVGELLGNHFGGGVGKAIGGKLGSYAHYIGRIFGSGDYVTSPGFIESNNLINPDQVPEFRDGGAKVRIAHREYLCDIYSSPVAGAFNIQSFPLNPGLLQTFPWFAQMCGSTYQQYAINGMVFEFKSTSSEMSTTTNLGYVVMATDYDSADTPFSTKSQMENTTLATSCKPSQNALHAIECKRSMTAQNGYYIRTNAIPSGADIRLYDLGRFSIATGGVTPTNVVLGELWCSWDITLLKPIMGPSLGSMCVLHLQLMPTGAAPLTLATTHTQPRYNSFPGQVVTTPTTITLPLNMQLRSRYMLIFGVRGASTASLNPPSVTFSGGLQTCYTFVGNESGGYAAPQLATGTTVMCTYAFDYFAAGTPAAPPTITFGTAGTMPGTLQGGDLLILQLPTSLAHNPSDPSWPNASILPRGTDVDRKSAPLDDLVDGKLTAAEEVYIREALRIRRRGMGGQQYDDDRASIADSEDYDTIVRSDTRQRSGTASQINGNNGSATNTDDVDGHRYWDAARGDEELEDDDARWARRLDELEIAEDDVPSVVGSPHGVAEDPSEPRPSNASWGVEGLHLSIGDDDGDDAAEGELDMDVQLPEGEYDEEMLLTLLVMHDLPQLIVDVRRMFPRAPPLYHPPQECHPLVAVILRAFFRCTGIPTDFAALPARGLTLHSLRTSSVRTALAPAGLSAPGHHSDFAWADAHRAPVVIAEDTVYEQVAETDEEVTRTTNFRSVARRMCSAYFGDACEHSFYSCYGSYILLSEIVRHCHAVFIATEAQRANEQLNGNNGSHTNSDDVKLGPPCDGGDCLVEHYHQAARAKSGIVAKPGAAKRIAKKRAERWELCVDEQSQPTHSCNCPCPHATHCHEEGSEIVKCPGCVVVAPRPLGAPVQAAAKAAEPAAREEKKAAVQPALDRDAPYAARVNHPYPRGSDIEAKRALTTAITVGLPLLENLRRRCVPQAGPPRVVRRRERAGIVLLEIDLLDTFRTAPPAILAETVSDRKIIPPPMETDFITAARQLMKGNIDAAASAFRIYHSLHRVRMRYARYDPELLLRELKVKYQQLCTDIDMACADAGMLVTAHPEPGELCAPEPAPEAPERMPEGEAVPAGAAMEEVEAEPLAPALALAALAALIDGNEESSDDEEAVEVEGDPLAGVEALAPEVEAPAPIPPPVENAPPGGEEEGLLAHAERRLGELLPAAIELPDARVEFAAATHRLIDRVADRLAPRPEPPFPPVSPLFLRRRHRLYLPAPAREHRGLWKWFCDFAAKLPGVAARQTMTVDPETLTLSVQGVADNSFGWSCRSDSALDAGPAVTERATRLRRSMVVLPAEFSSFYDEDIFSVLFDTLSDTSIAVCQELFARKVIIGDANDASAIQSTLMQSIKRAAVSLRYQGEAYQRFVNESPQIADLTLIAFGQKLILRAYVERSFIAASVRPPVFPKGARCGSVEHRGPLRVYGRVCQTEKPFVYNNRFDCTKGAEFFVNRQLHFRSEDRDVDGTYRTLFGPVFACNWTAFKKCNHNMALALRRLTCELEPERPGREAMYAENQRVYIRGAEEFIRRVEALYAAHLEHVSDEHEELALHYADPHPKRELRIQGFTELLAGGRVAEHDGLWNRKPYVDGVFKVEKAKAGGKYPRFVVSLGVEPSLLGFRYAGALKEAMALEPVYVNGGVIIFCKSPQEEYLDYYFELLITCPHRFVFIYFSDDSCFATRQRGRLEWFNVDISGCDASHRPEMFAALCAVSGRLGAVFRRLVQQCELPVRIKDCNDTSSKARFVELTPRGPFMYSGSTLTTLMACLASMLLAHSFSSAPDGPCDFQELAFRVGYKVTGVDVSLTHPEELQFLKHSPTLDVHGKYKSMLNLGVFLRASGMCLGDLPGGRSECLAKRAATFQASLIQGAYTNVHFSFIDRMRKACPNPGGLTTDLHGKTRAREESILFDDLSVCRRYGVTPSEYLELIDLAQHQFGYHIGCRASEKILNLDYGLDPEEASDVSNLFFEKGRTG